MYIQQQPGVTLAPVRLPGPLAPARLSKWRTLTLQPVCLFLPSAIACISHCNFPMLMLLAKSNSTAVEEQPCLGPMTLQLAEQEHVTHAVAKPNRFVWGHCGLWSS